MQMFDLVCSRSGSRVGGSLERKLLPALPHPDFKTFASSFEEETSKQNCLVKSGLISYLWSDALLLMCDRTIQLRWKKAAEFSAQLQVIISALKKTDCDVATWI